MDWRFTVPTSLEYFRTLVQSDEQFPLLEAAASLGQEEFPDLDVQGVLAEADQLLARLRRRLPADAPALHRLRLLNHFFFDELHFRSNSNDYYDAHNSYMHLVLQRRLGIPVSLAVLWLELAQGIGLSVQGIGFPGHFMVKVDLPKGQVLLDPCSGASLSREALAERLEPYRERPGLPDGKELPVAHFLRIMPARGIVARMLRNLKEIHRMQQDWRRLIAVENRLLVLQPQAWDEYRDRGLALAELGRVEQAVGDLETYLGQVGRREDTAAIAERVAELRRALD